MVQRAIGSRHQHKYYFGSPVVSTATNSRLPTVGDDCDERAGHHARCAGGGWRGADVFLRYLTRNLTGRGKTAKLVESKRPDGGTGRRARLKIS